MAMGYQRTVSSKFWEDSKVEEFSPEDRYTMLYLLTNPMTNLCGCYEISFRRMSRDLGYNSDMVAVIVDRLCASGVIKYDYQTNELLIVNWCKYNWTRSPKLHKPLEESIERIKSEPLRLAVIDCYERFRGERYRYGTDTVSIPSISISNTTNKKNKLVSKRHPRCAQCGNLVTSKSDDSGLFFCIECGEISEDGVVFT